MVEVRHGEIILDSGATVLWAGLCSLSVNEPKTAILHRAEEQAGRQSGNPSLDAPALHFPPLKSASKLSQLICDDTENSNKFLDC